MEQLNSNIERVIEANSTIEVLNVGAFYAFVRAYKYVVVDNNPVKEKINAPFPFDLYDKDNEKISTGTLSPGEKATFKVQSYKMLIKNIYDYEVHIVYSFGSGTVDQLKTNLEMTDRDLKALTLYDKRDFDQLVSINQSTTDSYEELDKITKIIEAETAIDKIPRLIQKMPVFMVVESATPRTYFNVFDLALSEPGNPKRPYFITHIDISFDYSQAHGSTTQLYVTNTFNPAMSFGKYEQLKDLDPDTINHWNGLQWTNRADVGLPTRSKSLSINNGVVYADGHFRVDINEVYGNGSYFATDNFILKTVIAHQKNFGLPAHKIAIRKYIDPNFGSLGPAGVTEKVLSGTYDFKKYNRCTNQKPIRTTDSNILVVDVCVYGYLLPR